LERICLRALAREPRHRFASMTEFAAELAAWLAGARQAGAVASEDRPPTPALPDPRAADGALQMLREWGWEQGLERLKRDTDAAAEPGRRAALQILTGWLAAERGHDDEALAPLRAAASWPALAAWALAGEAFLALRRKRYRDSQDLLRRAASAADAHDTVLSATLAHLRGTLALQEGRPDEALRELHTGLEQLGPSHFSTGRVLDTLGTVHALRNHFPFAHAFYEKALEVKRLHGDDAGVALTHGQLGRLYLSWGRLADADAQFRAGIEVARRTGDERGEAQLYNHRGQVQLARGRPVEAVALLAEAVRSATGRYPILEGYARKDRALASLMLGDVAEADHDIAEAERLFHAADFAEGLAHVNRVRGLIRRRQGRPEESAQSLRTAATWFEQAGESAEAADCLLELARTLRGRGAASILIEEALLAALDRAEDSRRPALVAAVESELREAAPLELGRRECRRLRGAANPERTAEPGSVLCVELHTTTSEGPLASLEVRNHLFADLARLFASEGIEVIQYRSDGLVALAQGPGHAVRAVRVALTVMEAISEVNRPRRVLGWPLWQAHTAIASGVIGVAAVGTFARRDYTTVGEPVCLAERLLAEARPDRPCIDDATHEAVAVSVTFDPSGPRFVAAREGPRRFWEVMGLARKSPECRGN
ncbi:MAG TPA: tetratricopeptide repeat protein, partial [Gemmataceae bacterium]|nr:tetratricopeptide repeat protein [Gemmataceae bacterium]